jgi:hypothetical protein
VAVATGIPPGFLMDDPHMLKAIVAVLHDQEKAAKRRGI